MEFFFIMTNTVSIEKIVEEYFDQIESKPSSFDLETQKFYTNQIIEYIKKNFKWLDNEDVMAVVKKQVTAAVSNYAKTLLSKENQSKFQCLISDHINKTKIEVNKHNDVVELRKYKSLDTVDDYEVLHFTTSDVAELKDVFEKILEQEKNLDEIDMPKPLSLMQRWDDHWRNRFRRCRRVNSLFSDLMNDRDVCI